MRQNIVMIIVRNVACGATGWIKFTSAYHSNTSPRALALPAVLLTFQRDCKTLILSMYLNFQSPKNGVVNSNCSKLFV